MSPVDLERLMHCATAMFLGPVNVRFYLVVKAISDGHMADARHHYQTNTGELNAVHRSLLWPLLGCATHTKLECPNPSCQETIAGYRKRAGALLKQHNEHDNERGGLLRDTFASTMAQAFQDYAAKHTFPIASQLANNDQG